MKNKAKSEFTRYGYNIKVVAFDKDGSETGKGYLPRPEDITFYNQNKVAKVQFADGTEETAVLRDGNSEKERMEAAVAICLLKKILEPAGKTGYGTNLYNKYIEWAFRAQKQAQLERDRVALAKETEKARATRAKAKKAAKKSRRIKECIEFLATQGITVTAGKKSK